MVGHPTHPKRPPPAAKAAAAASAEQQNLSQVFVRNLPETFLEPDIETLFGEHGPIKRIDLIKSMHDGAKLSKGFGFVRFALQADAAAAAAALNGRQVQGKAISVEIAMKKGAKREQKAAARKPSAPTGDAAEATTAPAPAAKALSSKRKRADAGEDNAEAATQQVKHTAGDAATEAAPKRKKVPAAAPAAPAPVDGSASSEQKDASPSAAAKKAAPPPPRKKGPAAAAAAAAAAAMAARPDATPAPEAQRTVFIFGIAPNLTKNALRKRVRKVAAVESVEIAPHASAAAAAAGDAAAAAAAAPLPRGGVARVVCVDASGVRALLSSKLDGHVFHDSRVSVRRAVEVPTHAHLPGGGGGGGGDDAARASRILKRHRLIVRNLPWAAAEADVEAAFAPFGPLAEVHIPRVDVSFARKVRATGAEETVTKSKSRGFAFVQFLCARDAATVVREHGVMKICDRDVAVDYALAKKRFEETLAGQALNRTTDADAAAAESGDGDNDSDGAAAAADGGGDDSDAGGTDAEQDEDEDGDGGSDAGGSSAQDEGGEEKGEEGEAEAEEEKPRRAPPRPDVGQGRTVFVRNVGFDATEDALRECFEDFGDVRLALLVKDKGTGMPRGTAFVKFTTREAADKCLAVAEGLEDGAEPINDILSGGNSIYLGGRALHVMRAVERDEAQRLGGKGPDGQSAKKDKRNLYLANEGLLIATEEAARETPKADMDKRAAARADKKQKLKNPLFFISPLRLSVRNLSRAVTDAALRKLAADAARAGLEQRRASAKDMRRQLEASGEDHATITPDRLKIPPVSQASVVRARVIRETERVGSSAAPPGGDLSALPSKGYGFMEFKHHGHALAALRTLNNNPAYSHHAHGGKMEKGEKPRLIVEFAVENHAKLKVQETRKAKQETRKRELATLGLRPDGTAMLSKGADAGGDAKKLSRGQRQRDRKRQLREQNGGVAPPPQQAQSSEQGGEEAPPLAAPGASRKRQRDAAAAAADPELSRMLKGHDGSVVSSPKRRKQRTPKGDLGTLDGDDRHGLQLEDEHWRRRGRGAARGAAAAAGGGGGGADGDAKPAHEPRWFE
ncbi:hypothetical protein JKP88DRAFT_346539 [Tribonema minus]|uniref:RRM domain-containing protein n=1 Tax=Tribonema minus TaxID=303371 RepID=A0A835ZCM5_9STRA|nr:hypothetical protein JKP88DRAFT_346539 [Tribonema minus]